MKLKILHDDTHTRAFIIVFKMFGLNPSIKVNRNHQFMDEDLMLSKFGVLFRYVLSGLAIFYVVTGCKIFFFNFFFV